MKIGVDVDITTSVNAAGPNKPTVLENCVCWTRTSRGIDKQHIKCTAVNAVSRCQPTWMNCT